MGSLLEHSPAFLSRSLVCLSQPRSGHLAQLAQLAQLGGTGDTGWPLSLGSRLGGATHLDISDHSPRCRTLKAGWRLEGLGESPLVPHTARRTRWRLPTTAAARSRCCRRLQPAAAYACAQAPRAPASGESMVELPRTPSEC